MQRPRVRNTPRRAMQSELNTCTDPKFECMADREHLANMMSSESARPADTTRACYSRLTTRSNTTLRSQALRPHRHICNARCNSHADHSGTDSQGQVSIHAKCIIADIRRERTQSRSSYTLARHAPICRNLMNGARTQNA